MKMTIPNLLSLFRIAAAPFLLLVSYYGDERLFFILLSLMIVSDALDGYLARKLHQCSKIGTKLDSIGDLVTYMSIPFATWWLWPEIIIEESVYIAAAIAIYLLPSAVSWAKFREMVAYHTWTAKIMAVFMSSGIILLLFTNYSTLFHFSVYLLAIEAAENILITLVLPQPQTDVRSLWHVLRQQQKR